MGYCLEITPIDEPRYFLNEKGLIMDIFTDVTKPANYLSNIKTCNSLVYVLAAIFKTQINLTSIFIEPEWFFVRGRQLQPVCFIQ